MFRLASLAIHLVHAGYLLVCSHRYRLIGSTAIGTYVTKMRESHQEFYTEALHAIVLFCEGLDDQFLVLRFPLFILRIRLDGRPDVILHVFSLSALFIQGNREEN